MKKSPASKSSGPIRSPQPAKNGTHSENTRHPARSNETKGGISSVPAGIRTAVKRGQGGKVTKSGIRTVSNTITR